MNMQFQLGLLSILLIVSSSLASEEVHVEVYGSQCAAYFEGVSTLDLASTTQNGIPTHIQVDQEASTFNCDSNNTQLLTIKLANNSAYDGNQISSIGYNLNSTINEYFVT
jgi:hypothetical protein